MPDWTAEQLADQKRICECDHLKNTHAGGHGKCLFAKLQAVNGYPGEAECLCQAFMEDKVKTAAYVAKCERMRPRQGIYLDRPIT